MIGHDELRRMVRNYPGGRPALAVRLGKPDETLRKELEGAQGFKLSVAVALEIQSYCVEVGTQECHAFAHVVAREAGGLFVPGCTGIESLPNVTSSLSQQTKEVAEMVLAVLSSINDEDISDNELREIQKEALDAVRAINRLVRTCEQKNMADKPEHIKKARRPR